MANGGRQSLTTTGRFCALGCTATYAELRLVTPARQAQTSFKRFEPGLRGCGVPVRTGWTPTALWGNGSELVQVVISIRFPHWRRETCLSSNGCTLCRAAPLVVLARGGGNGRN